MNRRILVILKVLWGVKIVGRIQFFGRQRSSIYTLRNSNLQPICRGFYIVRPREDNVKQKCYVLSSTESTNSNHVVPGGPSSGDHRK